MIIITCICLHKYPLISYVNKLRFHFVYIVVRGPFSDKFIIWSRHHYRLICITPDSVSAAVNKRKSAARNIRQIQIKICLLQHLDRYQPRTIINILNTVVKRNVRVMPTDM